MTVQVPPHVYHMALANLAEAQRIAHTCRGFATVESLEAADLAVMRQPTKADLRLAIRGVLKEARLERRNKANKPEPCSFSFPAMTGVGV